jgi:hypothetical protein
LRKIFICNSKANEKYFFNFSHCNLTKNLAEEVYRPVDTTDNYN